MPSQDTIHLKAVLWLGRLLGMAARFSSAQSRSFRLSHITCATKNERSSIAVLSIGTLATRRVFTHTYRRPTDAGEVLRQALLSFAALLLTLTAARSLTEQTNQLDSSVKNRVEYATIASYIRKPSYYLARQTTMAQADSDIAMPDATIASAPDHKTPTDAPSTFKTTGSKRRHHKPSRPSKNPPVAQVTIRSPRWCYIHLQHLSTAPELDALTAHLHLQTALTQFLGQHGSAILIDLFKLSGREVWVRVAAEDRSAVIAAVGGWVGKGGDGWRVRGWSSWSAGAVGREGGRELFG